MRYFIEQSSYLEQPVIYDDISLIRFAVKTYKECEEMGGYQELLSEYTPAELTDEDTALKFLNDRFSDDNSPFREAVFIGK